MAVATSECCQPAPTEGGGKRAESVGLRGQGMAISDDPYEMLAWQLVWRYNGVQLRGLLCDEEYLTQEIYDELKDQDYSGVWLDPLFQQLAHRGDREEVFVALRQLAESLADTLDRQRLERELIKIGNYCDTIDTYDRRK